MPNESQPGLKPIPALEPVLNEKGEDITDYKAIAEAAIEAGKQYEGLSKRNFSDLEKLRKDPRLAEQPNNNANQQPPKKEDKSEFDYGELAFLTAKGVPDEDHEFLLQEVKSTGKPLKELLNFNYVKEELKNRVDGRATQAATPTGTKRASQVPSNTVEYWVAKIDAGKATSADIPDASLRTKVVNARIAAQKAKSTFTDHPVV